ncbi:MULTISPECIES: type II toxin-antitoxin system RelE/ParE family toxin [Methylosinus]|uniref:Type II toxin-antitoxin system RelE/ParE family toxin n=1 Tax=Methylosinus trichosporium (strain ATCC 35070 / NCIMB 11131 / UNIQEM 75 / OB3b) TaxID=595536 RepID=A0A2D2CVH7_METT3|nr:MULTISPECIES: type II toxin-antitoxin system RelE/ParE family toxin [Methylosinus]ATQ66743.1 type II toxin-antitoxin system RelE/ParE family toxin [Methylosinus trichosporium OB3b]OBS51405.1 plasmid stabilization protein [Methylosinus sp. 3S-1]
MIVVVTEQAEADLEAIGEHIAEESPSRAVSFIEELREACEGLGSMSKRFPLAPRYEHAGIRRRVHGNYLIFYRIGIETVDVIHVLHGAMDYEPLLFPKG